VLEDGMNFVAEHSRHCVKNRHGHRSFPKNKRCPFFRLSNNPLRLGIVFRDISKLGLNNETPIRSRSQSSSKQSAPRKCDL
jgi:hypothetical protein